MVLVYFYGTCTVRVFFDCNLHYVARQQVFDLLGPFDETKGARIEVIFCSDIFGFAQFVDAVEIKVIDKLAGSFGTVFVDDSECGAVDNILNANVPDIAWADVRGFEVTRLGNRHRSEPCVPQPDPRGHTVYWIGPAGRDQDAGPGTDFHAVRMGYISITPIHVDLTRYQALEKVAGWVGGLTAALEASA